MLFYEKSARKAFAFKAGMSTKKTLCRYGAKICLVSINIEILWRMF
jgi:hypothetical protein